MPRIFKAKQSVAKDTSGDSSCKDGEAHQLCDLWKTKRLYPACAKYGKDPGLFSIVPQGNDVRPMHTCHIYMSHSVTQGSKLWCRVCQKSMQAQNERNKHRHEQSLQHIKACAVVLGVPEEELSVPYKWKCAYCDQTCVR